MAGQHRLGGELGVVLKGYFSGTSGQERDLRNDMAADNKSLREELRKAHEEIDELRQGTRSLSRMQLHQYTTREVARARVNALEQAPGLSVTAWPPDPPETLNPPGGTP